MSNKIYVAGNPCMPDVSKIGYSEDPQKRIRELSGTNLPAPFELHATYEIPDDHRNGKPDTTIHAMLEMVNPSIRVSDDREFFLISPQKAAMFLKLNARLNGREEFYEEFNDWKNKRIRIRTSKHHRYYGTLEVYEDYCMLKAGSRIKLTSGDTIDSSIRVIREDIIQLHCDANGVLRDDVRLASPYVAAVVLVGNKVKADSVWE